MRGQLTREAILVAFLILAISPRVVAQQAKVNVSGQWQDGHYTLSQNGDYVTSEGAFGHANGHFTGAYTFVMSWASATWTATVSKDGNRISWSNNTDWTRSGGAGQPGTKTQTTGILTVYRVHANCTTNVCAPSGCAACLTLAVYLPLNAQVLATRCYTNAGGSGGDAPSPQQVTCGDLDAWARFDPPRQYTTPTNTVVETVFHNRASRDRLIELQVDWR